MAEVIEQYRKHLHDMALYADKTVATYVSSVVTFQQFCTDHLRCSLLDVKPLQLSQWLVSLRADGRGEHRLEQHLTALKGFFSLMVQAHVLDHNPADTGLPFRVRPGERVLPLTAAETTKLLQAVERQTWVGHRNFVMIACLWALGLRCGELLSLKVGSFKPLQEISVGGKLPKPADHPAHKIGLLRVLGKGKKERVLFVVDALYDTLMTYLTLSRTPTTKTAPLFPTDTGKKTLSDNQLQKMMKTYADLAGLKRRVTPHVLRHSFATEMYLHHVPLEDIRVMMGHETKAETAIYIHVSDHLKLEALHRITLESIESEGHPLSWVGFWKQKNYSARNNQSPLHHHTDTTCSPP